MSMYVHLHSFLTTDDVFNSHILPKSNKTIENSNVNTYPREVKHKFHENMEKCVSFTVSSYGHTPSVDLYNQNLGSYINP